MLPTAGLSSPYLLEDIDGVQVLRLRAPRTKDIDYVRRTINEFLMPFAMLRNLRKSPLAQQQWDGVVWYAPTIFLGPIASALKKASNCRGYLIVRDIFPEWAADMGLMGRGLPYQFFKAVANYQYSVADVIGIQTQGNHAYFEHRPGCNVEVLQNWLSDAPNVGCSVSVAGGISSSQAPESSLRAQRGNPCDLVGRTIFVYAGNMGVAQGMDILLSLAERLLGRRDIGFVFVGRGSDAKRLREDAQRRSLDNVMFHDEIDPTEIPGLYAQCHIGIVALDPRHKTHNIPGKFLSYMQAGLPVLASINAGNDLVEMIDGEGVGRVCIDQSVDTLQRMALELVDEVLAVGERGHAISARCQALSARLFSPEAAVKQIVAALKLGSVTCPSVRLTEPCIK